MSNRFMQARIVKGQQFLNMSPGESGVLRLDIRALGRFAHQAHELADLQPKVLLDVSVAAARAHKIVAQKRILLPDAVRPVFRLAVNGG